MTEANHGIYRDAFNVLCDEQIGYGSSRKVWSSRIHRNTVIKTEDKPGSFQNVVEWETWLRVRDTPFAKWFAPCKWIGPTGIVLLQVRTDPVPPNKFPKLMPKFLCDFKRANYGMIGNQIVCHDYGTHLLFEHGMTKGMKLAKWWDET